MPGAVTVKMRLAYMEDISSTDTPGTTESVEVKNAGTVALTKVPLKLLTDLVVAADDAAAALAGVGVGYVYIVTATKKLKTRMS